MSRSRRPHLATAAILTLSIAVSLAAQGNPPNPYRAVANWAQAPSGMKWGGVISIEPDARGNVWVFHRGDTPILHFDRSGKYLAGYGAGMFVQPQRRA